MGRQCKDGAVDQQQQESEEGSTHRRPFVHSTPREQPGCQSQFPVQLQDRQQRDGPRADFAFLIYNPPQNVALFIHIVAVCGYAAPANQNRSRDSVATNRNRPHDTH